MAAWKHTICICAKRNEKFVSTIHAKIFATKKTVLNLFANKRATNHSAKQFREKQTNQE